MLINIRSDRPQILAKKYQFSARLLGFMCERPLGQAQNTMESENESEYQAPNISQKPAAKSLLNSESVDADVEQCIHEKKLPVQSVQPQIVDALSYYSLMDKVWHWTSLDWGRQCRIYLYILRIHLRSHQTFA